MNRSSRVLLLVVVVLTPFTASADPPITILDQVQAVIDGSAGVYAIGGPSEQRLAQTVTAATDGRLDGVMLPIVCASGQLILEIRDLDGGEPGPTVLSSSRFPAVLVPGLGPTFQLFAVRASVDLSVGDQFAIVLSNPTGSCGIFKGPVGDSYVGGEGFFEALPNPPGWVPFSETETRLDLPFMTLVRLR